MQRLDALCRETEAEEWRVVVQERLEDARDPGHETLHTPGTLHTFHFPPTRARYVKLAVLQSHDPYQVANLQYFYAGFMEGREIITVRYISSLHNLFTRRADDPMTIEADGLLIHNATARSQGTFTCRAEAVETGEVKERSFRVTVK